VRRRGDNSQIQTYICRQIIILRQPESGDERGQRYICRQIIILRQQESREMRGDIHIPYTIYKDTYEYR
jgi:hypothetical protein